MSKPRERPSPISELDLDYVRSRYLKRIAEHGVSLESMNSGGERKQRIRHQIHSEVIAPSDSVLDVGSGIGQFLERLRASGHGGRYHGLDLIPEYVEYCTKLFPDAKFELCDVFSRGIDRDYDVIVASQVFNAKYQRSNNFEVVKRFLSLAFPRCCKCVSIDMMSSYVDYTVPELYFFRPEEVFAFAKTLTRFVRLRHDYLPFEFSIQLFKEGLKL